MLGHVLLDVNERNWRWPLAEAAADGGEQFRAVMRRRMHDEQRGCAMLGGEFGLVHQRSVIRPAIAGETAFAGAIDWFKAQSESDFAVHVDVGIVVVLDRFAISIVFGSDAVAD
jgi:hypothetical protein